MNNILPALLIKNEEIYIERVVRPLAEVFGSVLVLDTKSEDETVQIVSKIPGVILHQYGSITPEGFIKARQFMTDFVKGLGFPFMLLVDGDELYSKRALELIRDFPIDGPEKTGFTRMQSVDPDPNGKFYFLNDLFCRHAVHPSDETWGGTAYPFDVPSSYENPANYFYYPFPAGEVRHAVHLHRLQRSNLDHAVMQRQEKQFQFSLQNLKIERTGEEWYG